MKETVHLLDQKEIGKRIRAQREAKRLTRDQLAAKLGITGKFISDIEYGEKGMSLQTLIGLSNALGMSVDFVLQGNSVMGEEENPELKRIKQNILAPLSVCNEEELKCMEQIAQFYVRGLGKTF